MTYYLIHTSDLFDVLAARDFPSPQSALEGLNPGEDEQVLTWEELISLRAQGAMSWVDETKGG